MGALINSGLFRFYSKLFISRQGLHVIALAIAKILNTERNDLEWNMNIHGLIEVPIVITCHRSALPGTYT